MIPQIRPAQLAAWFQTFTGDKKPVLLDVREPNELATASVKAEGFSLVAIPMNSVPQRLADLDPACPTAVLCHHGARSQRVASFLEAQGFAHLANVAGGIEAWALEVDTSVKRY
jgi:rhodanese-related sulfurtransferase